MVCSASGDVMWAPWVPNEEVECKRQGDLKVIAWRGLVDGKMLVESTSRGWWMQMVGRSL